MHVRSTCQTGASLHSSRVRRKLIKEMTAIIDPADDYLTITSAEEQMKTNYVKAKRENDEAYSSLKGQSSSG